MGNRVEVVFTAEGSGLIQTIDRLTGKVADIVRFTRPAGDQLDRLTGSYDKLGLSARKLDGLGAPFVAAKANAYQFSLGVDELNRKLEFAIRNARNLEIQESRLRNHSNPVSGGFDLGGSRPVTPGAGTATSRFNRAQFEESLDALNERRFNRERERVRQLPLEEGERLTRQRKDAGAVRRDVAFSMGFSALFAGPDLGPVTNVASQTALLAPLLGGLGPAAVGVAGVGYLATAAIKAAQDVRKAAEAELKQLESSVNRFNTGTLSEREERFGNEGKLLKDIDDSRKLGIQLDTLELNEKIQLATGGKRDPKTGQITGAGALNEDEFRAKFGQQQKQFIDREVKKQSLGLDNIFDQARKELASVKDKFTSDSQLSQKVNELRDQAAAGKLSIPEFQEKVGKLKEEMRGQAETTAEATKRTAEYNREQEETRKTVAGAEAAIASMRAGIKGDDPLTSTFINAKQKVEAFEESVKKLPSVIREAKVEQFKGALESVSKIDLFKTSLNTLEQIIERQQKITQLKDDHSFEDAERKRRFESGNKQAVYETEIKELQQGRRFTDIEKASEAVRQLVQTPGLVGVELSKAIEEATRGLSIGQLQQANLLHTRQDALADLAQSERAAQAFRKEPPEVKFAREFIDRGEQQFRSARFDDEDARQSARRLLDQQEAAVLNRIPLERLTPELRELAIKENEAVLRQEEERKRKVDEVLSKVGPLLENLTKVLEGLTKSSEGMGEAADGLKEQVKKGIGVDVSVKDDGGTSVDLGTSPGAETLFGRNFTNNY